ncbi:MAG: hypothetical protein NTV81_03970 [Candidatus Komeilibacteria bacterium]|nr:hypothetical protein [Candidatus Komeilibacteria bacterium]
MKIKWNEVTWYSKLAAIILFVGVFGLGLSIGRHYPKETIIISNFYPTKPVKTKPILVDLPTVGQVISSPLIIKGQASGSWFFEASFPVKLVDANNNVLGITQAQTQADWMTENLIPFEAKLIFNKPTTVTGRLILSKDNPSGLSEYDQSFSVPILFK